MYKIIVRNLHFYRQIGLRNCILRITNFKIVLKVLSSDQPGGIRNFEIEKVRKFRRAIEGKVLHVAFREI